MIIDIMLVNSTYSSRIHDFLPLKIWFDSIPQEIRQEFLEKIVPFIKSLVLNAPSVFQGVEFLNFVFLSQKKSTKYSNFPILTIFLFFEELIISMKIQQELLFYQENNVQQYSQTCFSAFSCEQKCSFSCFFYYFSTFNSEFESFKQLLHNEYTFHQSRHAFLRRQEHTRKNCQDSHVLQLFPQNSRKKFISFTFP